MQIFTLLTIIIGSIDEDIENTILLQIGYDKKL